MISQFRKKGVLVLLLFLKKFVKTKFGAKQKATRAQAAVMIYRLLEILGKF